MGKGLGSVEKKQNSKKAWGVGGRQLQTLKIGWGMLGLGQKGREKREEMAPLSTYLKIKRHI